MESASRVPTAVSGTNARNAERRHHLPDDVQAAVRKPPWTLPGGEQHECTAVQLRDSHRAAATDGVIRGRVEPLAGAGVARPAALLEQHQRQWADVAVIPIWRRFAWWHLEELVENGRLVRRSKFSMSAPLSIAILIHAPSSSSPPSTRYRWRSIDSLYHKSMLPPDREMCTCVSVCGPCLRVCWCLLPVLLYVVFFSCFHRSCVCVAPCRGYGDQY